MMINKRLICMVGESRKFIAGNVISQWVSLVANIVIMGAVARMLQRLYEGTAGEKVIGLTALTVTAAAGIRFLCAVISGRMGYLSSKSVKKILRQKIYQKLLRLGSSYSEKLKTSEIVQVAVEGVDQLETYFGSYLPQFFYAMLAPLTLFCVLSAVNLPSALVLLLCVPMIPVTIAVIQRWAKKLLSRYWSQYTALGDTFLENLQGLTTAKIYQADERDGGGAALGVILAVTQFRAGRVDLFGCILIILLAADFFLPMRLLGSFFHIAMNGMAASDKIFGLLDLEEPEQRNVSLSDDYSVACQNLRFSYEPGREILHGVSMCFPEGSFTAIVGESGCGKSTLSAILMGRRKGFSGEVTVGKIPLSEIREESLMKNFTYISHQSYLFKGTVRENLLMASPKAGEDVLWHALEQVNLADFLRTERGLDTPLDEKASNLSGGQRQRLALARALLHDSPVYIFDEATSNIDVESENDIMAQISALAGKKTVILISHRLANAAGADHIYVLDRGNLAEEGDHKTLLAQNGIYAKLWNAQQELENYRNGGNL